MEWAIGQTPMSIDPVMRGHYVTLNGKRVEGVVGFRTGLVGYVDRYRPHPETGRPYVIAEDGEIVTDRLLGIVVLHCELLETARVP